MDGNTPIVPMGKITDDEHCPVCGGTRIWLDPALKDTMQCMECRHTFIKPEMVANFDEVLQKIFNQSDWLEPTIPLIETSQLDEMHSKLKDNARFAADAARFTQKMKSERDALLRENKRLKVGTLAAVAGILYESDEQSQQAGAKDHAYFEGKRTACLAIISELSKLYGYPIAKQKDDDKN